MFKFDSRFLVSVIVSISSICGIVAFQKDYQENYLNSSNITNYRQQEQKIKAEANFQQKMPDFGFSNLIANFAYLQYIQYFGDSEARDQTGYSVVTDYFETVVKKDPKFLEANLALSAANSIFAGNPEATVSLLEKSAKSMFDTESGYPFMLLAYKAVDEILFLGDLEAAKRSYTKAAEWADEIGDETALIVAQRYRDTVKFLDTDPDPTLTQISGWNLILQRNRDPKVQQHAIQKIEELGGKVSMDGNGRIAVELPKTTTQVES